MKKRRKSKKRYGWKMIYLYERISDIDIEKITCRLVEGDEQVVKEGIQRWRVKIKIRKTSGFSFKREEIVGYGETEYEALRSLADKLEER